MKIEKVKITEVKRNTTNPRIIKDDKFLKLVESIKTFPQMLEIRPIVVNDDMVVLGGNMRLKACQEAGLKEVFIIKANQLTELQQKEFVIKDNVGFGEWDWAEIANNWSDLDLGEWGLDLPIDNINEDEYNDIDYSERNKELNVDDFKDEMVIKLNYNEADYNLVKQELSRIASTPEQAIWKLLKL